MAPTVVAELVAPDDFNKLCRRDPFFNREEFLEILQRLENTEEYPCRDDAWAATAELLAQSAFDLADLPALLWKKALPLLNGNSLGRMLAMQVRLGLFTTQQAVKLAFRKDHPRAAGMNSLDSRAPEYFASFHQYWLRFEEAEALSEMLPAIIKSFPDKNKQPKILGKFLVALAEVAPAVVANHSGIWLPMISSYHGDFLWDIWVGVVPHLAGEQAAPWIKVLNADCKCPRCGGEGRISQETIKYLQSQGYSVGSWTPDGCGFCKEKGIVPGFVARLAPVDGTWSRILKQTPYVSMDQFQEDLKLIETDPSWENAWWSAAVRLTQLDSHPTELGKRLWKCARTHLDDFGMGVTLACLVSTGVFGWREAAELAVSPDHPHTYNRSLLNSSAVAEGFFSCHDFWLRDENIRQVCAEAPQCLEHIPSPQNLFDILSTFAFALPDRFPEALVECEDFWFRLLGDLPKEVGSDGVPSVRELVVIKVCRSGLGQMSPEDAEHWTDRLIAETDGLGDWHFSQADGEILKLVGTRFGSEKFESLLPRMLERIRNLPDSNYAPFAIGCLALGFSGYPGLSLETYRCLCEFLFDSGMDEAFSTVNIKTDPFELYPSAASNLVRSISRNCDVLFGWEVFQYLVRVAGLAKLPVNRAESLAQLACGLNKSFPGWRSRAILLLLDRTEQVKNAEMLTKALEEISKLMASIWQQSEFKPILARLIELSRSVTTKKNLVYMAWIPNLIVAIPDILQALPVRIHTFETIFENLEPETGGTIIAPLMDILTALSIQGDFSRLFQKLLAWIDRLPVTNKYQSVGLINVLERTACSKNPFGENYHFLANQIVHRLLNGRPLSTYGRIKYDSRGFDNLRREYLKTGQGVILALEILSFVGRSPDAPWHDDWFIYELGHLASAIGESTAALPVGALSVGEFDRLMTDIQKLPMLEAHLEYAEPVYRGIPRLTALQAMLRRFQQVGDEAWRDGLIDRMLEHARSYEDPAHQKLLVGALLEGLGEGELTNWHKAALHKIANFTGENDRSDLSILQAGIVRKLLGSGDIPSASRLAAGIPDIDWRNQSLADVARVVAPSAPSEAVGMLEEILSPEVRGKLAVDLSALPSMTGEIEQVWALLRAAADDPETIQGTLVNLLERADAADLRGLITSLGLSSVQSQKPSMRPDGSETMDPVATILQSLEEAELITSKKRDRLSAWRDQHRAEIDQVIRKAVLDYMVAGNQVSPEDAEELERRPLG